VNGQRTVREIHALLRGQEPDEEWLAALAADTRAGVRQLAGRLLKARERAAERARSEERRLAGLFVLERARRREGYVQVAGVDEAGVGPLAGPVVAAAVLLPGERIPAGLNDSKVLRPEQREQLYGALLDRGVRIGIGLADVSEIDRVNILQATRLAWRRAVAQLVPPPDFVLIDGRYRVDLNLPQLSIVGGDRQSASIAAASIVAKVTRDRVMRDLDARYPEFGFAVHKGYATPAHLAAIRRHGFSPVHRRSFLPLRVFQQELSGILT